MKKVRRLAMAVFIFVMIASLLGACTSTPTTDPTADPTTEPTAEPTSGLPIVSEKITLKFWMPYQPYEGQTWSEHPFFEEMENRTNIHIEFDGPAAGQDVNEAYTAMISSGSLPDVIMHIGNKYPTGPDQAIEDNVYIKLNDYVENDMPNFKAFIDGNDIVKKIITSPDGNLVYFPNSRPADATRQPPYVGPIVRYDLLQKIGQEEPVTLDDWYEMLKALKTQLNMDRPLSMPKEAVFMSRPFLSAFDVDYEFFVVDGTIKYGVFEQGLLDYVTLMKQWYDEELIALEEQDQTKFTDGTRAAWLHGYYMLESWKSQATDPNYRAIGVKYPVKEVGDTIKLFYGDAPASDFGFGFVVTTANQYPQETCRYFDYWYGDEGTTLALYGIEDETFEFVDGSPKFTDYMTNNPDDKPFVQMLKENTVNYLLNDWKIELAGFKPDEVEAIAVKWAECKDTYSLPGYCQQFTAEESQRVSELWGPINSYVLEMLPKFIKGEEPLNNWGNFVQETKDMGVEEIIEIRQAAYDRFFD